MSASKPKKMSEEEEKMSEEGSSGSENDDYPASGDNTKLDRDGSDESVLIHILSEKKEVPIIKCRVCPRKVFHCAEEAEVSTCFNVLLHLFMYSTQRHTKSRRHFRNLKAVVHFARPTEVVDKKKARSEKRKQVRRESQKERAKATKKQKLMAATDDEIAKKKEAFRLKKLRRVQRKAEATAAALAGASAK